MSKYRKQIGNLGEDIATKFLMKQGFTILDRNYLKKWGELDIVAFQAEKVFFIEVKSVSCENYGGLDKVTQETNSYRPEESVHYRKQRRLARTIETYLNQYKLQEREWRFWIIVVYIDRVIRKAKVKVLRDIIL